VAEGALIVDMREINFINVAEDKKTATIGGGVLNRELVYKLEEEGVLAACGNTPVPGYVGWATLGGFGPMTNLFGMGFEGIVAAQVVTAKGEIVEAPEDMLEGIRGMGGNLGIITSLTITVYQTRKVRAESPGNNRSADIEWQLFSGMIIFDFSRETVEAVMKTEAKLGIPKCLELHHFILQMPTRKLAVFFTWADGDPAGGQAYLDKYMADLPQPWKNSVATKTVVEHYEAVPSIMLPYGGQRSAYLRTMPPAIVDILMDAAEAMPAGVNLSWTMSHELDRSRMVPNTFGEDTHIFLSWSDMVPEESMLPAARAWNDGLYEKLWASKSDALLETAYAALSRTEDRTAEQLFGDRWSRARELKDKFDPDNVFKYAVPRM
jgi:hypothetical protein